PDPHSRQATTTCTDQLSLTDHISLEILNTADNIAAIIPLTPFVTADGHGFVAPPDQDITFIISDEITVHVPAGAFDQPTLVTATPSTKDAFSEVPNFDTELDYKASVNLSFDCTVASSSSPSLEPRASSLGSPSLGSPTSLEPRASSLAFPCRANKPLDLSIPVPANTDPTKQYLLGWLGQSIRGPRIMIVDTLRIDGDHFTTTPAPSIGTTSAQTVHASSTFSNSSLYQVRDPGTYVITSLLSPYAWVDVVVRSADLYWSTSFSLFVAERYITMAKGHVYIPVLTDTPFRVYGVDATGFETYSRDYDGIVPGDPGVSVALPSASPDNNGPYPVWGSPYRVDSVILRDGDVIVPNIKVNQSGGVATVTQNSSSTTASVLSKGTKVQAFDVETGAVNSATVGDGGSFSMSVSPVHSGDRLLLFISASDVDPSSLVTVVFNEPLQLANIPEGMSSADAEIANEKFLHDLIGLEHFTSTGWVPITDQVHFRHDSGDRRIVLELPSSLVRGDRYRVHLSEAITDAGDNHIGSVKDSSGKVTNGAGLPLDLEFTVRSPHGAISSFDIDPSTAHHGGLVRDIARNDTLVFVSALDGGILAYDTYDPAALAKDGSTPAPLSFVPAAWTNDAGQQVTGGMDEHWALAVDKHGRVFSTGFMASFSVLRTYRVEDFWKASTQPMCAGFDQAPPHALCRYEGSSIIAWRPGVSLGIPGIDDSLYGLTEGYPRKIRVIEQDDGGEALDRDNFASTYGGAIQKTFSNGIQKLSVTVAWDTTNPYQLQRITVENLTQQLHWSADATPTSPAVISEILAKPDDKLRIVKNERTWAVVSLFGYGIATYDVNAIESNDSPDKAAGYTNVPEQLFLSSASVDDACDGRTFPTEAIRDLAFSPDFVAKVEVDATTNTATIGIDALDVRKGVLDVLTPIGGGLQKGSCLQRWAGLIVNDPASGYLLSRFQGVNDEFTEKHHPNPFIRFSSADYFDWTVQAEDNTIGLRGSEPGTNVHREYALVAGGDYGLLVVEIGGDPLPSKAPVTHPLDAVNLVDDIWFPAGAYAVRAIPGTSMAAVLDGKHRLLLVDLSRIDERWDEGVGPNDFFPIPDAAMKNKGGLPDEVGVDDPRIIWKSKEDFIAGSIAPIVDPRTGIVYAGDSTGKKVKIGSVLDPRVRALADPDGTGQLREVGSVFGLGVKTLLALPSVGGLSAFRFEVDLPGGVAQSISDHKLHFAVESERLPGVAELQTAAPWPLSSLRLTTRSGEAELTGRQTDIVLEQELTSGLTPEEVAELAPILRKQEGSARFVSPWIVVLADPRASETAAPPVGGLAAAGCENCVRPEALRNKSRSDGVYEIMATGPRIAIRPECELAAGCNNVFAGTPYEYLGQKGRLEAVLQTTPADTIRPTEALVAAQNPPVADGMFQDAIYLHSGELETVSTDLDAGGRAGFEVTIDRFYRSRSMGMSPLGNGWDSPLYRRLRQLPDGSVEYRDGADVWIFKTGDASTGVADVLASIVRPTLVYKSPAGLDLKLVANRDGWVLIDQQFRLTRFDTTGRLVSESDVMYDPNKPGSGNVIHYLYDDEGRLARIVDPVGRETTLTYWHYGDDPARRYPGLLAKVTDWRGREVEYDYDAEGRLTDVRLPEAAAADGVPSKYSQAGAARPVIHYTYDKTPSQIASGLDAQHSPEVLDSMEFVGNLGSETDPAEVASGGPPRVSYTYGAAGDALTRDRISIQHWPCGNHVGGSCSNLDATLSWTASNAVKTTDVLGQVREYTLTDPAKYDEKVHIGSIKASIPAIDYSNGLPEVAQPSLTPTSADISMSYEYDDAGEIHIADSSTGLKTQLDHKAANNGASGELLYGIVQMAPSIGQLIASVGYDNVHPTSSNVLFQIGRPDAATGKDVFRELSIGTRDRSSIERTDAGTKSTTSFDDAGRVKEIKTVDDQGTVTQVTKLTPWGDTDGTLAIARGRNHVVDSGNGSVVTEISYQDGPGHGMIVTATDQKNSAETVTSYDAADRPIHVVVTGPSGTLKDETYGYDASGRLAFTRRKQKGVGNVTSETTFDAMGRVVKTTLDQTSVGGSLQNVSASSSYDLSGHTILTEPLHAGSAPYTTETQIDTLGRVVKRTTNGTTDGSLISVFGYDKHGQQSYVSDTVRTAEIRQFDDLGRQIGSATSDGRKTITTWSAWNEPLETTEYASDGSISSHDKNIFTSHGRLRATNEAIVTNGAARQSRFSWDDGDKTHGTSVAPIASIDTINLTGPNRRAESVVDDAGRTIATRMGLGNGIAKSLLDDGSVIFGSSDTNYLGTLPLSVTTREPLAGAQYATTTSYDVLGRPIASTLAGIYTTKTEWDEAGDGLSVTRPGTSPESATYDSRGLVLTRTLPDNETQSYQYDSLGGVTTSTDEAGEPTIYTRDDLGRVKLIRYPDATTEETQYEPVTGAVLAHKNRAGTWLSYAYDAAGRVTEVHEGEDPANGKLLEKYQYDAAGRLQFAKNADAWIEYADYDLLGRRHTTRSYRLAGDGLALTATTLDIHTQRHDWNVYDERSSWHMPVNGFEVPNDDPNLPWLQTIVETRDAGSNLVGQARPDGTLLTEATPRGAGRVKDRTVHLAGGSVAVTSFAFEDGNPVPPTGDEIPGLSWPTGPSTGFPLGDITESNGTVISGSLLDRDSAARVAKIDLAGLVSHESSFGYDGRGRLQQSLLIWPDGKLDSAPKTIDTFVPADFLTLHEAPSALSTAQNQKLGEKAWSIEPATWSASRRTGGRIGTLTLSLPGLNESARTFQYTGGRRTSDGVWTYTWDDFERLTAMENPSTSRRIEFRYDTSGRVISRTAYRIGGTEPLLEDRGDILAKDGLPADTTFVWDPIADRLVAIFEGRQTLVPGGPKPYDGLLRQMLHGDQGYD
ncbi:MAG: DUF6531 domain-containing protein, partial [Thermoanaerobaculia bacterium]